MTKKERMPKNGKRKRRKIIKKPEMKYYLIVTDTEATERCYFEGLRRNLPLDVQTKLRIEIVDGIKTKKLVEECKMRAAYDAQYRMPWIVFDRDQVTNFDAIIAEAKNNGIHVAWSNPCFEIWLLAYFGSMPVLLESQRCCSEFGRVYEMQTGRKYRKSDVSLYERVCKNGDEEGALRLAERRLEQHRKEAKKKPSEMCPATTVHELVGDIRAVGEVPAVPLADTK